MVKTTSYMILDNNANLSNRQPDTRHGASTLILGIPSLRSFPIQWSSGQLSASATHTASLNSGIFRSACTQHRISH